MDSELDTGNTAWLLMSTAMVMLMTPGLGFFHSGLTGHKNTTNTILMSMMSMAIVTVEWVLVGYSFSFGSGGNHMFGKFREAALRNLGTDVSDTYGVGIPSLAFVAFQNMFAQITPALISGAVLGRMSFISYVLFILIWTLGIYNPVAYWVWSLAGEKGWLVELGNIDFAGGNVIHIASGFSSLAVSLALGKRVVDDDVKPNNLMIALGTSLLWFGWFGFNAGSQLAADEIAALAFINTHIAACVGLITWTVLEYLTTRQVTAVGTASGVIAGLVAITPGCGYVDPMVSFLFGFMGAFVVWLVLRMVHYMKWKYDLDAFAIHGIGGVVGAIMTGLFAQDKWNSVIATNGTIFGGSKLILYQLAGIGSISMFSMIGSFIIIMVLKYTVGIKMSKEQRYLGADESFHGGNLF